MTSREILQDLKNKIFRPVYFFHGEEPFFMDELTSFIEENALNEADRDFNQQILYGRDVSAQDIADASLRFPMMSNYQVIIVREAQEIDKWEALETYFKKPSSTTILVINHKYKKLDKRKSLYKTLDKNKDVVLFESAKMYDDKLPAWITQRAQELNFLIKPQSALLLADHIGNDLSRINNELLKLTINLKPGETITNDHIEEHIGISKEFNVFELNKALGKKDVYQALRIVQYFESNPKSNPLFVIVPVVYSFFVKVMLYHQFKNEDPKIIPAKLGISGFFLREYQLASKNYSVAEIKKIMIAIHSLDLKNKGLNINDSTSYGPLKEFIIQYVS
ncbi:MAG: DNA polymerase III subunit delta [Bacteroidales bacterium]|nr:DNA polymerase III subunit delta [Bacteroidales bacterium]